MRQLGNAVPVQLARIVVKSIREQIECSNEKGRTIQSIGQEKPRGKRGERVASAETGDIAAGTV